MATIFLTFGLSAIPTSIEDPTPDFSTCAFAVTSIDALRDIEGKHLLGSMLYGQKDAIPTFCGLVSGTLLLRATQASALLRSMACT
ncbi:hypothetical protein K9U59_16745 [Citrobacter sedlakii]|nr:hypothetical protein [Citrobacter sedlakii]EIQ7160420.1 hypothetical protein [Citrobacter sedlakii]MBN6600694.1 hypothetical protein [Citrobacter sedlakii]